MKKEPETMSLLFDEEMWKVADQYFESYTHVCPKNVPSKFGPYVTPMKEVMKEQAKVVLKYGTVQVVSREEDKILLEGGQTLMGRMISKAYRDAGQIVLFAASVINIDEILARHSDSMERFFLEYWAVAMLSVSRECLEELVKTELAGSGKKQTTVWSPGQSRFELANQKPLFTLLQPESMGLTLDKNMRMLPLKSISGTIGLVDEDVEIEMISCDYCEHARICPGYKGVRFHDYDRQRRLI